MMDYDVIGVVGIGGSGKSVWIKECILKQYPHIVYDAGNQFEGCNRYLPRSKRSMHEFERFNQWILTHFRDCFVVWDELHNYVKPYPRPLPSAFQYVLDSSRPTNNFSLCYAARSMSKVHGDVWKECKQLVLFEMHGRGDIRALNDIHVGLGNAVDVLKPWEFVIYDNHTWQPHPPLVL